MGICAASSEQEASANAGRPEEQKNAGSMAWGEEKPKNEKKPKVKKADRVQEINADPNKKEISEAKTTVQGISGSNKMRDAVRPKDRLVAPSTGTKAENSPGRAAPGFMATPEASPKVNGDLNKKLLASVDGPKQKDKSGKAETKKQVPAAAEPQKPKPVVFQKPTYDVVDEVVDDLPCEVLSNKDHMAKKIEPSEYAPANAEGKGAKVLLKPKFDFLKKGTKPLESKSGKTSLAPLAPAKTSGARHKEFRRELKKIKKGSNKVRRLEKKLVKKFNYPKRAADLILQYAAIKTSGLTGFQVTDIACSPARKPQNNAAPVKLAPLKKVGSRSGVMSILDD